MLFVFDINETLLDLSPLDALFADREQRVEWFDLMIRTALVRTAADDYRAFGALGLDAAEALGITIEPEQLRTTMATLPAHPDVAVGLAAVVSAGHRAVALGNSALALVEAQLSNAGIREHFAATYSADEVDALKPAPQPYRQVLDREGVAADDAVLVAAHDWDIAGAAAAGLRTVYVDRGLRRPLPGFDADLVVATIGEVTGVAR